MRKAMIQVLLFLALIAVAIVPAMGQGGPCIVYGPFNLERPIWTPSDFKAEQSQVFPEGCFGYGFETWMILYNSTDEPARFMIVASGNDCYFSTAPFKIRPHQRLTYDMHHVFVSLVNDYFERSPDVSFRVLADKPGIYAQESMYWNNREGGNTSTGIIEGESCSQ